VAGATFHSGLANSRPSAIEKPDLARHNASGKPGACNLLPILSIDAISTRSLEDPTTCATFWSRCKMSRDHDRGEGSTGYYIASGAMHPLQPLWPCQIHARAFRRRHNVAIFTLALRI